MLSLYGQHEAEPNSITRLTCSIRYSHTATLLAHRYETCPQVRDQPFF